MHLVSHRILSSIHDSRRLPNHDITLVLRGLCHRKRFDRVVIEGLALRHFLVMTQDGLDLLDGRTALRLRIVAIDRLTRLKVLKPAHLGLNWLSLHPLLSVIASEIV